MPKHDKKQPLPNRYRPLEIRVMATSQEKRLLLEAAKLMGSPLSVWLRGLGLKEARRLVKQS